MLYTAQAYNGMVVAPHRLAAQAGLDILRKGGNAAQAAVAVAAALCVVYPHMTGLGGDAFWLILPARTPPRSPEMNAGSAGRNDPRAQRTGPQEAEAAGLPFPAGPLSAEHPHAEPLFIDACGRSAGAASREWFEQRGGRTIPKRGPMAALTMAGAVSGWEAALDLRLPGGGDLSLTDIFSDAIALAEDGFPVSVCQSHMTELALAELRRLPGFAEQFLPGCQVPEPGQRMRLPQIGRTLRRLLADGLDSFYRGPLASGMAADLARAGSPLGSEDFERHRATVARPLCLRVAGASLFNSPPPTQGLSSLAIIGLVDRLCARADVDLGDPAMLVHAVVEATKQAFLLRDAELADPDHMRVAPSEMLDGPRLDALAARMLSARALPWPPPGSGAQPGGDTVWFGVMDGHGSTVSCIQSIYHEFGSGLVLPESGVTWHNRGLGFRTEPGLPNSLAPGKKPLHTLNPALAVLNDGRVVAYGTMGGDGQPQTQAAIFTRYARLGQSPQAAVSGPRWLLGRAWGDASDSLKLEDRFPDGVAARLKSMGHEVEMLPGYSSLAGHAGMLVRHPDGLMEGAADPRSDGSASGW